MEGKRCGKFEETVYVRKRSSQKMRRQTNEGNSTIEPQAAWWLTFVARNFK